MAGWPRRFARTPYDSDTPPFWAMALQARCHRTPGLFCWARRGDANNALDVGEPGFIRRPGCRITLIQIQPSRLQRKGKPTGDGTRPEPGRATSLEGSTPSPSAFFRGRLTAGRRALNPQVLARFQPPELAPVGQETSARGGSPDPPRNRPPQVSRSKGDLRSGQWRGQETSPQRRCLPAFSPGGARESTAPSEGAGPGSIPGRGTEAVPNGMSLHTRAGSTPVVSVWKRSQR